jgi:hypothetical protein
MNAGPYRNRFGPSGDSRNRVGSPWRLLLALAALRLAPHDGAELAVAGGARGALLHHRHGQLLLAGAVRRGHGLERQALAAVLVPDRDDGAAAAEAGVGVIGADTLLGIGRQDLVALAGRALAGAGVERHQVGGRHRLGRGDGRGLGRGGRGLRRRVREHLQVGHDRRGLTALGGEVGDGLRDDGDRVHHPAPLLQQPPVLDAHGEVAEVARLGVPAEGQLDVVEGGHGHGVVHARVAAVPEHTLEGGRQISRRDDVLGAVLGAQRRVVIALSLQAPARLLLLLGLRLQLRVVVLAAGDGVGEVVEEGGTPELPGRGADLLHARVAHGVGSELLGLHVAPELGGEGGERGHVHLALVLLVGAPVEGALDLGRDAGGVLDHLVLQSRVRRVLAHRFLPALSAFKLSKALFCPLPRTHPEPFAKKRDLSRFQGDI